MLKCLFPIRFVKHRWVVSNSQTTFPSGFVQTDHLSRTAWIRSPMPNPQYERLSTSDEPLEDERSRKLRLDWNAPLAKYLLLVLTFIVVTFCSYKAGQWSVRDPQHAGSGDINTGTTDPKPDNSSTDTPTMPGNGKYSVG